MGMFIVELGEYIFLLINISINDKNLIWENKYVTISLNLAKE